MRGRKGQPAEVRKAKGNPGKRATRPARDMAAAAKPKPAPAPADTPEVSGGAPRELTKAGKAVWSILAPQLIHSNIMRQTDRGALTRYCDTLADYWKVTRALRRKTHIYLLKAVAGGKMPRVNPLFTIQERLAKRLDALEDRFGLTPRSRQEILYRLAQAQAPQLPLDNPAAGEPAPESDQDPAPHSPVGFLNTGDGGPPSVH